ncbi:MAG: diacylglycerol kinase [Ilumatobacteraceae bacterium]|nr:diacylglycerol kinase [Ilumatobacteraceae bacterium]
MTDAQPTDAAHSEFDRATAVVPRGDGTYDAQIEPSWDINGNANGGYLMALAVNAMRETCGRADPLTVTAHYLSPGRPGPITIDTSVVKSGRQLATVTGSMRGADREILRLIGSFGDVGAMSGGFREIVGGPPDLPPKSECIARDDHNGPVSIGLMNRLKIHLRPEGGRFNEGIKSGRAEVAGWFEFADGRTIDTLALMLVVDAFPPPVFNVDIPVGWVPTVELTVHVRGIPAPGPLACRFHTEYIQNGFLSEDSEIWDSTGALVAQSRQLALVPRG